MGMEETVEAASAAIGYSRLAIEYLEQADEINLRCQLDILMDAKYKTPDEYDARFDEARDGATMILHLLKDQANTKKEEVNRVKNDLMSARFLPPILRTCTGRELLPVDNQQKPTHRIVQKRNHAIRKKKVEYLRKQYSSGPATNNTGHTKRYIEYLDKLAKSG